MTDTEKERALFEADYLEIYPNGQPYLVFMYDRYLHEPEGSMFVLWKKARAALQPAIDVQKVRDDAAIITLLEALQLYADPSFYHACSFKFDPPTGGFDGDFDYDEEYGRNMPGKLARQALVDFEKTLATEPYSKPQLSDEEIYSIYKSTFEREEGCVRPAPKYLPPLIYGFARAILQADKEKS